MKWSKKERYVRLPYKNHTFYKTIVLLARCIFLDHLTPSCNKKDIEGKFNTFGKLQECKVFKRLYLGESITAAFVIFESKRSAEQAVKVHRIIALKTKDLIRIIFSESASQRGNAWLQELADCNV